jgi:pimeloyl-ACP methyl ester carboxylesterase
MKTRPSKTLTAQRFLTSNQYLLLKRLVAYGGVVLLFALSASVLWLAYTRSIYLIAIFFAIVGGGLLIPYLATFPVLHPTRTRPQSSPANLQLKHWEDIGFYSTDGLKLGAWFIPPNPHGNRACLILVHGLGGNRGSLLDQAAIFIAQGYGVLLMDLRNHGRSQSAVTTLGYLEANDVCGAFHYLQRRTEVDPQRIGLVGHSMGGAAILRAASLLPQVRAIIAESTYTSLEDNLADGIIAQAALPAFPFAPLLTWFGERFTGLKINQVRPIDNVAQLSHSAMLFIHGGADQKIGPENSFRLYLAARGTKKLCLVPNAGHDGLMQADPQEFERVVVEFLAENLK